MNLKNKHHESIVPNFALISNYHKALNEDRFYIFYEYYLKKNVLIESNRIIKKHKLITQQNDIIFFLVELGQSLEHSIWAEKVRLATVNSQAKKQNNELIKFLSKLITQKKSSELSVLDLQKTPAIKSIKFITDKSTHDLTLDSYPICYDIINLIESNFNLITNNTENINLNSRQFEKNFILSLKPFVSYLNAETKVFKSKNKIYEFIIELIDTLNYDVSFEIQRFKDAFKPSKTKG
ncbi:MAG: hypothetical protein ACK504_11945 [Bacteroidota bacterium]